MLTYVPRKMGNIIEYLGGFIIWSSKLFKGDFETSLTHEYAYFIGFSFVLLFGVILIQISA